jgi:formate dehydrogenase major subunit
MEITRREFLKTSGAVVGGVSIAGLGFSQAQVEARAWTLKIKDAVESTTICPYCAVGCGIVVHTDRKTKKVINTEGDADHPINEGALCAKGAALSQWVNNDKRLTKVLYRAPNSEKWQEKSWEWAINEIAKRVKETRDASFKEKNDKGQLVNRTTAIAHVGSAALDNEECWTLQAMMRALGLVYIEHQARI